MIKALIRLAIILLVFIGIVAAIGSMLPRDFDFQLVRQVNAPPGKLFPYLSDLQRWPEFWPEWDSKNQFYLKVELGPITSGVGASQTWEDPRGTGKMWVTESTPDSLVAYQFRFGNFPVASNQITLTPNATGTEVTWSSQGRLPSGPFYGFFRGIYCEGMRRKFDSSLELLEKLVTKAQDETGEKSGLDSAPKK